MKNAEHFFQTALALLGGFFGWFLGGIDGFIYALIAFVVVDYLTGIVAAIFEKELSSEIGFRGVFKKVLIFVLVGVGNILDVYLLKDGKAIRTMIIFFYLSNEGISILENAARVGLPVPKKLKALLRQIKH